MLSIPLVYVARRLLATKRKGRWGNIVSGAMGGVIARPPCRSCCGGPGWVYSVPVGSGGGCRRTGVLGIWRMNITKKKKRT